MSGSQRGRATGARRRTANRKNRTNRKPAQGTSSPAVATDQPGVHSTTLRRTIRRTGILVGTTVAAIVFVLSVTGVVLIYELGVNAREQGGDYRASHFGLDTEQLAALAGQGRHAGETASTLVLQCGQSPCPSHEQMLAMAAAHLDVPYSTLAATVDGLGRGRARERR